MKRCAIFLCLMALFFEPKSFANSNCESSFNLCDLSYTAFADYLYWKVARPDNTRASVAQNPPIANRSLFLEPTYSSGYRVGGGLIYKCLDFNIRYTSLRNRAHSLIAVRNLTNLRRDERTYRLNYQLIDLALGYTFCFPCNRGYLKPFAGVKFATLKEQFSLMTFTTVTVTANTFRKLKTQGWGPMVGLESNWILFPSYPPLALVARADVSIVNTKGGYSVQRLGTPIFFRNKIPLFLMVQDIYLGLKADFCNFFCFDANVQVGYETQIWSNLKTFNEGTLPNGQLGLGGLVARFSLFF